MKKITIRATNGRRIFARMNDENTEVILSMRQISYLLAGLCGYNHEVYIDSSINKVLAIAGYDGGYSKNKHAFHIEESNGFYWMMIPGMRRPRRKVRA